MKCPGQDTQYWDQDAIFETRCPECDHPMEFFKDEATRRCAGCGKKIVNPKMDFGCASYCRFAEQCLGTLPEEFVARQEDLFKDRVAVEVKRHLGTDFKRIGRIAKAAGFAEKIGKAEKADLAVLLCAAYLYDIVQEPSSDSSAVPRKILEGLGAEESLITSVCEIIQNRHVPKPEDTLEYKCLCDAYAIARMAECGGKNELERSEFNEKLDRVLVTEPGKRIAYEILIPSQGDTK